MAKSAAERQAAYRKQRPFAGPGGNGERRLNTYISTRASIALERLAVRYGVTKAAMLEKLIIAEDDRISEALEYGTPEYEAYHEQVKPSCVTA
jgi:hypothetical protein